MDECASISVEPEISPTADDHFYKILTIFYWQVTEIVKFSHNISIILLPTP
jgi:hypothetical protein